MSLNVKEKPLEIQILHHKIKAFMDNNMYLKVYWDRITLIRGLNHKISLNIWKKLNAEKLLWTLYWFQNCFLIMRPIFNRIAVSIRVLSSIVLLLDAKKVFICSNISLISACLALDLQTKFWLFNVERINHQKIRFLKEMMSFNSKIRMKAIVISFHVILLYVLIALYDILNM